jgi:hypothetical protein
MGAVECVHLNEIWKDRNVLSSFEAQWWLFPDERCLRFLSIFQIREFGIVRNSTEKHTSQAVVICVIVHQVERPSGDQVVRSEHGTHGCVRPLQFVAKWKRHFVDNGVR